ncbi:hypothetical protein JOD51_001160 [Curtobacterium herbarum]|nr:hypothetical protein [Curtobacterium herbarum]
MPGPRFTDADFTADELAELIVISEFLRINMPEDLQNDPADSGKEDQ